MPPLPPISDAEWDVMNVLWSAGGPLSANDVVDRLTASRDASRDGNRDATREPRRDRSPRTVKTLLNRLINKGALAYDLEGKRYLYRPRVARDQCVREETRSFLSRVFANAPGPMLLQFVAQARLTPEEIEALKRLLDKKGK